MNLRKPFNPWPWAIIAAFVIFAGGTIALVVISTVNRSELVSDDYYEQELRYQQRLDRQARTRTEAPGASLRYDAGQDCLLLSLPGEQAARRPAGVIHLYRAASARDDHAVKLILDAEGRQRIPTAALARGPWKVRVVWIVEDREYGLEQNVILPRPKS